tara:strand:- start:515 stop:676 length:162 start_codon:yes stop_codon:yes gene_type:complete
MYGQAVFRTLLSLKNGGGLPLLANFLDPNLAFGKACFLKTKYSLLIILLSIRN